MRCGDGRRSAKRSIRWQPVELVIDHSVQVDFYGSTDRCKKKPTWNSSAIGERYSFLRWGQTAFHNFKVVPPNTGIVHQVNLEYLARVVFEKAAGDATTGLSRHLVGTDSHTTMINGLGVVGWGVGGIEAEAAMLGQPVTMLIPQVIGFKLRAASSRAPPRPTGAQHHRDAAQVGRRREVRRVLRRRTGRIAVGRSRHDRQHVARIRQYLRHVPDR